MYPVTEIKAALWINFANGEMFTFSDTEITRSNVHNTDKT